MTPVVLFSEILRLWFYRYKFCHCLTKPIITRIIVYVVFRNVLIRTDVLFSEILRLWLNRYKFCHHLRKPIITRIIMYLVFEIVIIRIEIIVFRDFATLVK